MHFFLHGGMARVDSEQNKKFFQSICKDGDKILICVFASEKPTREERFGQYQQSFTRYNPDKKLLFELASDNISTLIQQMKNCSLIYFGGGYENLISTILKDVPNLHALLQNKTICGSSAGANIRSTYYYEHDFEGIGIGLGFLPIKTICHRGAEYSKARTDAERFADLDAYGEKLPVYTIPEQEYIEFTL